MNEYTHVCVQEERSRLVECVPCLKSKYSGNKCEVHECACYLESLGYECELCFHYHDHIRKLKKMHNQMTQSSSMYSLPDIESLENSIAQMELYNKKIDFPPEILLEYNIEYKMVFQTIIPYDLVPIDQQQLYTYNGPILWNLEGIPYSCTAEFQGKHISEFPNTIGHAIYSNDLLKTFFQFFNHFIRFAHLSKMAEFHILFLPYIHE